MQQGRPIVEIMTYRHWDIPADLFHIQPVGQHTINNFIGRNSLVREAHQLIAAKNTRVVFEGGIGMGKTSLGNYIRFTQKNSFTTNLKISCQAQWQSQEFLLALQASVISTCQKGPRLQELLAENIFKRILERNSNIRISNYQGGATVVGIGGSTGKVESISQPVHFDDQTLISELGEMLKFIKQKISALEACPIECVRIIFQLNNLDPSELPFTEEKIVIFLNNIRDILTDKVDASFIINGTTGLIALIGKSVKRLAPCIVSRKIYALSKDELVEALNKRIQNSDHNGSIPFTPELIEAIYDATNGNFRETLGLMEILANHYDSKEPLIQDMTLQDCYNYFFYQHSEELESYMMRNEKITNKGKAIRSLSERPMLNISELGEQIGVQQGNTSKLVQELEDEGILIKVRDASSTKCFLSPRLYFASILFFKAGVSHSNYEEGNFFLL